MGTEAKDIQKQKTSEAKDIQKQKTFRSKRHSEAMV
jgi:hypothetical protein